MNWEQFCTYVSDPETGHFLRSHGIATSEPLELFKLLDEIDGDPNGLMDLASFILGMQRVSGGASGTDMMLLLVESRKAARSLMKALQDNVDQLAQLKASLANSCHNIEIPPRRRDAQASTPETVDSFKKAKAGNLKDGEFLMLNPKSSGNSKIVDGLSGGQEQRIEFL